MHDIEIIFRLLRKFSTRSTRTSTDRRQLLTYGSFGNIVQLHGSWKLGHENCSWLPNLFS